MQASNEADYAKARDDAFASARYNYVAGLLNPAKTYVDATAQAERNHAVAYAAAELARLQSGDEEAFDADIEAADTEREDGLTSAQQAYATAEASALAARLSTEGTMNVSYPLALELSRRTRTRADADALRDYEVADSQAYVTLTLALAELDETYWLFEATTLETSAASLAASSPSPWATYFAAQQAANADWVATAAEKQAEKRVKEARGQAGVDAQGQPDGGGEIGIAESEYDLATSTAEADWTQAASVATAGYASVNAQAAARAIRVAGPAMV